MRRLRNHGSPERYLHTEFGWNARMDAIQAAVLHINYDALTNGIAAAGSWLSTTISCWKTRGCWNASFNSGGGRFRDASAAVGPDFQRLIVGRGLAIGDFDNDGDLDALAADLGGQPVLSATTAGMRPGTG